VKCISKIIKVVFLGAVFCAVLTGCGRVITDDYESMLGSEQINPMVTSQESVLREKSFAYDLCLPEDTKAPSGSDLSVGTAGLFDLGSRNTIYGSDLTTRVYPASTTKLMTALVALKYGSPSQKITISENAAYPGADAQRLVLEPGDSMSLEQAINYLLVFSANDVAIAIAENIGGSYDEFVNLMNTEARAIGATGTHFTNPHGLHDEDHYTTPYDLYLILNEAVKYDLIRKILPQADYNTMFVGPDGSNKSIAVRATDAYLTGDMDAPEGITVLGGKTGTTEPAGHCLVILSENAAGNYFISVVMKTESLDELYSDMNLLLSEIPN